MKIIGIDPGTARVGWGIIDSNGGIEVVRAYGCLETDKKIPDEERLLKIFNGLQKLINQYKIEILACEDLFFATNAKTAISVGQARGVILLTAALSKIPVYSYTPMVVKQAICGTGSAEKKQVQYMVKAILKLQDIPKPDDAADALAIALTHVYSYKIKGQIL